MDQTLVTLATIGFFASLVGAIILFIWIARSKNSEKHPWAPCPNCGHLPEGERGCEICRDGPAPGKMPILKDTPNHKKDKKGDGS